MKAHILNTEGKITKEIELPACFNEHVREDLILKVYLADLENKRPRYAPYLWAGMQHSASGQIKHARRKWKTAYGYGISRVPRKIMTRRGSRFFWVGATISSARGGREAHPPKLAHKEKKINKKEKIKAIKSAIAATASQKIMKEKYNVDFRVPIIFDSQVLNLKIKELRNLLEKYFGRKKFILVTGEKEKFNSKIIESCNVKQLNIEKLSPGGKPGRVVVYTENAIEELRSLK